MKLKSALSLVSTSSHLFVLGKTSYPRENMEA